ncbi:tRNA (adenosine(37)-N6)-threonylcarbamoyltransferase complex ATPase subunit type 1 TsaE [Wielerella bovis]|uniref:tRNA (adenosine(37)-N6)-threonylcarbamoyltransferase complex ATPase subunit type 1 TsaE n=1 Tax=Wielerella bovis TaxID=2917790 RepID=UPI00201869D7|nr:tRNA (adenosine(37)-N6)-threonylcarbamoyltransferase complex ATPase subunit type 1 TsaE [Wielerella bovis]MCG7657210.1 tRNA (adenosine(37)-N6)-threonylcarbamoyltransferase complex ATPase subunit type 1 TsaE [Wielerella bovis]MCG7659432.1 tRNA (adenosine(37)-N6)-threonylcarbamoyltransferase complex ATPase subunit type 1 TsaE [Wielerella bovis]ULJ61566.1 tRNA (adenosine(37)-N6)-threonylcarbamoyltransferase complex ATPase subunit type 1 TsaE [Wielerella bovis]ULJ65752.1 tRNA (adenosine(37)-N6)-
MQLTQFLPNEAATLDLGASWAKYFHAPTIIYLQGNLGAGKTTFTRGLLRGLGHTGTVKSPTYAIVESYTLPEMTVHHFDLYRFATPEEWEDAGLDDLIPNSLCLIEWAQQGGDYVPPADFIIELTQEAEGRRCTIHACHAAAEKELEQWQN